MQLHESDILSFGHLTVRNDYNEPVQLSSLWEKNRAVLYFVRHFG